MKKDNIASVATAKSIGMQKMFEFTDDENEKTEVYTISKYNLIL